MSIIGRVLLYAIVMISLGCGNRQEDARVKLSQMNIEYSKEAFWEAVKNDDSTLVSLFLASGMGPDIRDEEGNAEIVEILEKNGANSNWQDREGKTALMIAASKGNIEIAKILLAYGADKEIEDKEGRTVIDYMIETENVDPDMDNLIAEGLSALDEFNFLPLWKKTVVISGIIIVAVTVIFAVLLENVIIAVVAIVIGMIAIEITTGYSFRPILIWEFINSFL